MKGKMRKMALPLLTAAFVLLVGVVAYELRPVKTSMGESMTETSGDGPGTPVSTNETSGLVTTTLDVSVRK